MAKSITVEKKKAKPGHSKKTPDKTKVYVRQKGNEPDFFVILHGATDKPESHLTAFEKIVLVREGISKKSLEHLKEKSGLDYDELASTLDVARATLINKKGAEKFSANVSEKIVGLADIYSYGYEVFEDKEAFNQWIKRPNKTLGGSTPYELLDSQFGREEVRNLIGRIEYGVYS
jgi:putative toxin-antitoxin system antitoxin component (TIGR02293 family)